MGGIRFSDQNIRPLSLGQGDMHIQGRLTFSSVSKFDRLFSPEIRRGEET
jgi:hypothetical protein